MSQRVKRQQKRPRHLNEYVLGTNHSKYSEQAKSAMEYSDESEENITFIPPKPKIAKLNKVVNPNEAPNAEVDSSKETEVDLSKETEVDLSKKTEVDSSKEIHGVTKPEPVLDRSKLKRKIKVPARFELEPEQIVIKKKVNQKQKIN